MNFSIPAGYTSTIAPQGYPTLYWNGSGFATGCKQTQPSSPVINSPQLVTVQVTSSKNVVSAPLSFVVTDPETRPVPTFGNASKLVFLTSPNSGQGGTAFPTQPIVAVEDSNGNVVTSDFSNLTLSISSGTVGATLSGCTGAEFKGVVTFSGCSIDKAGTYILTASDTETNPTTNVTSTFTASSSSFTVTAAPASQLVFSPATAGPGVAGTAIPSVSVQVEDTFGNLVTNASGSVALSIKTGSPQSGFTSGTATVGVVSGVASFSNLVLNTSGSYTLVATPVSISGVTGVVTAPLVVAPAVASSFTVTNPGSQTVGSSFAVSITAYDAFGNVATGFAGSQSLSFSGPSNSPNASAPIYPTSVNFSFGLGTASGITLVDAQTTTLRVAQGGVSGATGTFTVTAQIASVFQVAAPASATAGTPFTVSLTAGDIYGNVLSSYGGSKTIAFSGPFNSPNGTAPTYPATVTFASGVGSASVKLVDAQSTTLTATQGSITGTSSSLTINPAAANKLAFNPATPGPGTIGVAIPNLSVLLQDSLGNTTPASGSVIMTIKSGSAQAAFTSGTATVSVGTGVAAFSNLVVTTAGTYTLTATPSGITGVTAAVSSGSFIVNALPNITTLTLPGASLTGTYSQTLAVSGGTAPYAWSVSSGSLPAGLSLSTGGVISGTVSSSATSQTFTVKVIDANGASDTQVLTLTVNPVVNISTMTLQGATKTGSYSQTLAATGGTLPYTWSLSSGSLPTGLNLAASSGVISGTVSSTATAQTFTVLLTDANGVTDTQGLTITVNAAPNISTSSLPGATASGAYSQTLAVSGGTTLFTWSVSSGALPSGLSIGPSSGTISGTVSSSATSQTFTVKATDANGVFDTQSLTIAVNAAPSVATTSLPGVTKTGAYSQALSVNGGTGSFTWSATSGSPPTGLTLSSSGIISGTASSTATSKTFTVKVTDANGVSATQSLTITVNAVPAVTTSSLPAGTQTGPYDTFLAASGGTSPYTWTLLSGTIPAGLTGNPSTGEIFGTLTSSASSATLTVEVIDADGVTATKTLTLTVNNAPNITTASSLPGGTHNVTYSKTLAASGGTAPLTWSLSSGTLPAGLSMSSAGVISGKPTSSTTSTSNFSVTVTDANGVSDTQGFSIRVN